MCLEHTLLSYTWRGQIFSQASPIISPSPFLALKRGSLHYHRRRPPPRPSWSSRGKGEFGLFPERRGKLFFTDHPATPSPDTACR